MPYKYNKDKNILEEQPEMKEPEYFSKYEGTILSIDHRSAYLIADRKYKEHIASLKTYPVSGNCKWVDGQILEEGKDFETQMQIRDDKNEWMSLTVFKSVYDDLIDDPEVKRIVAIPIEENKSKNMNTYTIHNKGLLIEDIPFDSLTVQLQKQGLSVNLPHEIEENKKVEEEKEDEVKLPIRLKHFNLSYENWLTIKNNTVNSNEVVADTLYQDESEIKGDVFHSEKTAKMIGLKRATDMVLSLLREGVKISFLDNSKEHIRKLSPPLYNKYFLAVTNLVECKEKEEKKDVIVNIIRDYELGIVDISEVKHTEEYQDVYDKMLIKIYDNNFTQRKK